MFRHGLGGGQPIWSGNVAREPGAEWTLHEAAERLGVHRHTAYLWLREGRLRGCMAARGGQRIWLVRMSSDELDRIRAAALPDGNRNPT